jgi:hypothetical protein
MVVFYTKKYIYTLRVKHLLKAEAERNFQDVLPFLETFFYTHKILSFFWLSLKPSNAAARPSIWSSFLLYSSEANNSSSVQVKESDVLQSASVQSPVLFNYPSTLPTTICFSLISHLVSSLGFFISLLSRTRMHACFFRVECSFESLRTMAQQGRQQP